MLKKHEIPVQIQDRIWMIAVQLLPKIHPEGTVITHLHVREALQTAYRMHLDTLEVLRKDPLVVHDVDEDVAFLSSDGQDLVLLYERPDERSFS